MIFLKMYVHKCACRVIDIYPNQINDNASKRMGLRASFERYTGNTSWLITLLHLIKVIRFWIFFSKKLAYSRILWIFSKQLSTNESVEASIIVQMIWIVVRWKKEVLTHLLSYTVDFQVVWTLFLCVFKVYPWQNFSTRFLLFGGESSSKRIVKPRLPY